MKPGGLTITGFCFFRVPERPKTTKQWSGIGAYAALLACLLASEPTKAETIFGKVVGVTDGDTITLLDENLNQRKIRLDGIDAPEKAQPFGQKSKEHLAVMVHGMHVKVEFNKMDRYQRTVGKIIMNGRDVNLAMVKAGYAWHFKKYQAEQTPTDQSLYNDAENDAKAAKRGLWSELNPIAPWEWRAGQRTATK